MAVITTKEYQEFTDTTAKYPPEEALNYIFLNLAAEAGEAAGKYAKAIRDDWEFEEFREKVKPELGDVLWHISQACNELGFTIDELMLENRDKLRLRMMKNTIHGEGDYR